MSPITVIAKNTFKELIRDRVIYGILVFAVLLVLVGLIVAQLSYTEQLRITIDLGLAGIEICGIILSIFLGATIVFREVEKRTILTLLARPLTRGQFLLGKFWGLLGIVLICYLLMLFTFILVLFLAGWTFEIKLLTVVFGFLLESALLISITMFLGVLVRPTLSVPVTIGIFLIGRSLDSLAFFMEKSESQAFILFGNTIKYLFPNFHRLDWKTSMVSDAAIGGTDLLIQFSYCVVWVMVLQSAANLIFRSKDIA